MSDIPSELKIDIIRRIGHRGFRELRPFIQSGREGRDAAFSPEVLKEVGLHEFILVGHMALPGSRYRSFLMKCLENGNETAKYIEAVRMVRQEQNKAWAWQMLAEAPPELLHATFALGVFLICGGEYDEGQETLMRIWDQGTPLQEAVNVADEVVGQLASMGIPRTHMFDLTLAYEGVPWCVFTTCSAVDVCHHCFAFWYSSIVASVC